jgi:hypothetical protein
MKGGKQKGRIGREREKERKNRFIYVPESFLSSGVPDL